VRTFLKKYRKKYLLWKATKVVGKDAPRFGTYTRVYHVHLRKTAGTSLNSAFWALGGCDLMTMKRAPLVVSKSWSFVRNNLQLIESGSYHYANSHIPYWKLRLPVSTFTFTMFRDPLERLQSLYTYYLWIAQTSREEGLQIEPYFDSIKEKLPEMGKGFGDFIAHLPEKHLMNQLYMFSETLDVDDALVQVEKLDKVYFQSNFEAAILDLSNELGCSLEVRRERKFPKPQILITDEEKVMAKRLLEKEYHFYEMLQKRYL